MRSFAVLAVLLAAVYAAPSSPNLNQMQARDCNFIGCAAALGPTFVACVGAALQEEVDPIFDAACFASAADVTANQPAACVGCY